MSGSLLCAGERNWIKVVKQTLMNCINVILLSCKITETPGGVFKLLDMHQSGTSRHGLHLRQQ